MPGPKPPRTVRRDLTSGSLAWNLFRLAAPMTVGMLLHSAYSLADAFWLGRLSEQALAAQTVSWPFMFLAFSLSMGFGTAGTALVSQYTGADRHGEADRSAGQTILLLCSLSLLVVAPIILLAPVLVRLVQAPTPIQADAATYLRIMMCAMPLVGFIVAFGAVLRGLGDTLTAVKIGAVSVVLNIVLDPIFIFGLGGMPALGVAGAAWASLLARAAEAALCGLYLSAGWAGVHLRRADFRPDRSMLRKLIVVGGPVAVGRGSDSLGFLAFQTIVNTLGTTVIAAVRIGFAITRMFNMPSFAVASAAAPIVGQALGAGKPRLARRTIWSSTGFVALVMFVPLVLVMMGGQQVAGFFVDSDEVRREAGRFFLVVPASSYVFGVLTVLLAAFYGSGHTAPAFGVGVIRLWCLRVPLALLLVRAARWGSFGAYFAMVVANIVTALITLWLFSRGEWEKAVVPQRASGAAERDTELVDESSAGSG